VARWQEDNPTRHHQESVFHLETADRECAADAVIGVRAPQAGIPFHIWRISGATKCCSPAPWLKIGCVVLARL